MTATTRIKNRLSEINTQRAALDAEEKELNVVLRVLAKFDDEQLIPSTLTRTPLVRRSQPPTIREYVQKVMMDSRDPWMTANEIQKDASTLKGSDIPMTSISPTLTILKSESILVRDGLKVALADRVQTNKAPNADASEPYEITRKGDQTGAA